MDNIDHNPTATTATTSFHGTSISLFQHPTSACIGEKREPLLIKESKVTKVPELPDSFTNIQPAFFKTKNPLPPKVTINKPDTTFFKLQLSHEYDWLECVDLADDTFDAKASITWPAYHTAKQRSQSFEVSITSLLPLLREQAHSVSTIRHVMKTVEDTVAYLNPGQVPVIAADQPIYAVAKQIQWYWPEQYGEDKFVIMFGGLHIEMAALKSLGTLLKNSGWTGALVEAGIASSGKADSFLSASCVTRTRQMHQVTASTLFKLRKEAYLYYSTNANVENVLCFKDWSDKRESESIQFKFWNLVLTMEFNLVILSLVRAFREANFTLYCQALSALIPFFFANNNVNYARWLPIHLRDMLTLADRHPKLSEEFHNGKFVVHKSSREFSAMAIDQAHEQANAVIKGDGGAVCVTDDASALRRWMVAGPEVSHLIAQYEAASEKKDAYVHTTHHEQTEQTQKTFFERVNKLHIVMKDMGNLFQEESGDLLALDTKDIADHSSAQRIVTHYSNGLSRFQDFMKGLELDGDCKFYQPIKRSKLDFFEQESRAPTSNHLQQKILKEDCRLFSKLFISCQSRDCDLLEFFCHENQSFPAALSDCGKLHSCQKSQLTSVLESLVVTIDKEPKADVLIIDGSALVNSLSPKNSRTFEEYAEQDVVPIIQTFSSKHSRIDIVFDVYWTSSLKAETRLKRGMGARRRVTDKGDAPKLEKLFEG